MKGESGKREPEGHKDENGEEEDDYDDDNEEEGESLDASYCMVQYNILYDLVIY